MCEIKLTLVNMLTPKKNTNQAFFDHAKVSAKTLIRNGTYYCAQNILAHAEACISTPQRSSARANGYTFSCFKHIFLEVIVIWPNFNFSWQKLMHRLESTIIFP